MDKLRFLGILVVAFLLSLFAQGVFVNASQKSTLEKNKEDSQQVLSATSMPTNTSMPTRTPSVNMNVFIYPGSTIKHQGQHSLILQSTDSTVSVTNWYRDKIRSSSMNVVTMITTSSNGSISNKLVGSNGQNEISIEIIKQEKSSDVSITVNL